MARAVPAPAAPVARAVPAPAAPVAREIDLITAPVQVAACSPAPLSRREARSGNGARSFSAADTRPRDLQRIERRRRAVSARRDVSFAGLSQKVAIAAAASGMVLTVALPTTAAVVPSDAQAAAGQAQAEPVQAAANAEVTFDRAALHGRFDPDAKLVEIVSASDGGIIAAESRGSLSAPLDGAAMSSPFGTRISPITGMGELHTGQDMSEACGTAVKAAAAGTVTFAGWHAFGGGNRVVVKHANGLETTYNHLSAMDVSVGQVVERGEAIARVGSTGASTGCHLHFEVLVDGENVDPLGWL
ncbi:Peptidase family M23 [Arthrobacter subterraneus]|uniref:Peptidase family M23 n=1 Tax=Arthrobacter subterraneus TaxID=335973 RepID=A0A1G8HGN4_9MICC|nr:Peptidase family M23 [Arthrobacter subterraneus]